MDKNDFKPDTRYTVTWRSPDGKVQAANIYVHRAHDHFLVVRFTGADAVLRKITYPEVLKIVAAKAVDPNDRSLVPAALLEETTWRDRVVMEHYSSSPRSGK